MFYLLNSDAFAVESTWRYQLYAHECTGFFGQDCCVEVESWQKYLGVVSCEEVALMLRHYSNAVSMRPCCCTTYCRSCSQPHVFTATWHMPAPTAPLCSLPPCYTPNRLGGSWPEAQRAQAWHDLLEAWQACALAAAAAADPTKVLAELHATMHNYNAICLSLW
jgi:hypothetical protein